LLIGTTFKIKGGAPGLRKAAAFSTAGATAALAGAGPADASATQSQPEISRYRRKGALLPIRRPWSFRILLKNI
jgi:hypothetical protein